jgi:para-aminobenzoate synthetase component 1
MLFDSPQQYALPYLADSARLFLHIAEQQWSIFLDSGLAEKRQGRFDILATDPMITLVTEGNKTTIYSGESCEISHDDPFNLIKKYLPWQEPISELPFNGGAMGYFSYDLGRRLEILPNLAADIENIPDMAVGIYHWAVVIDHQEEKSYLVGNTETEQEWHKLTQIFSAYPNEELSDTTFKVTSAVKSNMTEIAYTQAFNQIKNYLKEGDCYQVNLAQRFVAECEGNLWTAYCALRQLNSAPFSAYFNLLNMQILSSSPERFLKVSSAHVETKPIKGTRPKKSNQQENQQQIDSLKNSLKDRAENLMIVDLLRNDISKTCIEGSVKVPKLFDIESYETVHHLVSTVSGKLNPKYHALDLLRSCFPGGSITGAPKIRAMEIIEELEPNRRGVYCGSMAYIGFDGNMDSNITIRTLVHSNNTLRFWAGGGIVYDSIKDEEYQESFDKAAAMLKLLEQFQKK